MGLYTTQGPLRDAGKEGTRATQDAEIKKESRRDKHGERGGTGAITVCTGLDGEGRSNLEDNPICVNL